MVLRSGFAGYVTRWLRNAALVAAATGSWLLGSNVYHASQDGQAEAHVMRLEIVCVLAGNGVLSRVFEQEVECSDTEDLRAANAHVPVSVREVTYARLAFQSGTGADYTARISLDDLKRGDIQRGETVAISYNRADPSEVRATADAASYKEALWLLGSGLLLLAGIWLVRRAANAETNIDTEIEALEAACAQRTGRSTGRVGHGRPAQRPRR